MQARALPRHYREKHSADSNLKKFQCDSCSAAFKRRSDLDRHWMAKHARVNRIEEQLFTPEPSIPMVEESTPVSEPSAPLPPLTPLVMDTPAPVKPVMLPPTEGCLPILRNMAADHPTKLPVPFPVATSTPTSTPTSDLPGPSAEADVPATSGPHFPVASSLSNTDSVFPNVVRELHKLESYSTSPLPCDALKSCPMPLRAAVTEALGHPELRDDLKKIMEKEGFVLLSKDELQDIRLEARKRGKETAEAVSESRPREEVQKDWEEGQGKTISSVTANKWVPVPRQMTIQGQVVAFDFRMRLLDVEVIPKDASKPPKSKPRKSRKKASSSLGAPAAESSTATSASVPASTTSSGTSSNATTPNSAPEEIDLYIGPPTPITID